MSFQDSSKGSSHRHEQHGRSSHHSSSGYYVRPSEGRSGSSFFSRSGSSSYYKRRPRNGYISYLIHKLKRLVQDLWSYARRHPVRAFFAVVVPLISAGGALHGLLQQFGVKLPLWLNGVGRSTRGGYYESSGYGSFARDDAGGGMMGNMGNLVKIAQAFM